MNISNKTIEFECLSCGIQGRIHITQIEEDEMGRFIRCSNCEATSNIWEE